jgi:RNA polymerase sigma factor (sigma-70 family)
MSTGPRKAKQKMDLNQSTDTHLVRECLRGKDSAWSALINKYKNLIYSIPIKYGFSEEDAADIFQSVCMDLLAELEALREPQALAGWLIQITRNKCFHRRQEQQRHQIHAISDEQTTSAKPMPEDVISQIQREQLLRETITKLSPRCRKLLHMLFFEQPTRPYQEVALDLNLAIGSIGFIRKRCLEKLGKRLQEMGFS